MSRNVKEFLGITQNSCTFQGKVVGDPIIAAENYAYMVVRTAVSEQAANGSWMDVTIDVPIITTDPKKVTVLKDHVKDGRELLVEAYYTAWQAEGKAQHGFMIKRTVLGRKKYEPRQQG
jgi:hypothetical protein